jgi:DNA polymerase-3 subunit beta
VAGIVERRHTLPILANVLLRKNGGSIEFTTSDLEIQVRTSAELGGDAGSFSTTVGARKLIDILRSLPADQVVTLSSAEQAHAAGRQEPLHAADAASRRLPAGQRSGRLRPHLQRAAEDAEGLINQVHFAMAVHDIRYYLNGILFIAEGKTLTLVATDGHRLALAQATLEPTCPASRRSSCRARPCWNCSAC